MAMIRYGWIGAMALTLAANAQADDLAGRVQFAYGGPQAVAADGTARALNKGDAVNVGDTLVTGPEGNVQVRMVDRAVIALRPETKLMIDTYRFHNQEDGDRAVLRLVRGTFRSITGAIGHENKKNYRIITHTATVGIRGTDHDASALPEGTYDKVNTGATYIADAAGRVDVDPNEVGFASSRPGVSPVLLERIPGFLRSTPPIAQGPLVGGAGATPPGIDRAASVGQGRERRLARGDNRVIPDVVKDQFTIDRTVDFTGTFAAGTSHVAGVYGDRTSGVARNGAFTTLPTPAEQFFAGKAVSLAATDPASKFIYARGPAPVVASGSGSFTDSGTKVAVNWGVYGTGSAINGHTVHDQYTGAPGRKPDYMQVMGALETPAAVVSGLSGTYSTLVTSTPIIAESGAPGGAVTSANIVLASGNLTQYSVGLTDGLSRSWSASCSSCAGGVALTTFKSSGVALAGSGPSGSATGQANGAPVGPTGQGVISSFSLTSGSALATGSFAVTK